MEHITLRSDEEEFKRILELEPLASEIRIPVRKPMKKQSGWKSMWDWLLAAFAVLMIGGLAGLWVQMLH